MEESKISGFFSFRTMVSLSLVKIIYIFGFVGITISAFVMLAAGITRLGFPTFMGSLALLIIGNLAWRLICESWALFFSMHESVEKIAANFELVADELKDLKNSKAVQKRQEIKE